MFWWFTNKKSLRVVIKLIELSHSINGVRRAAKNNHLWSLFVLLTYFFDTKNWKGKSPSAYTWSSQDPALGVSSPSSPLQSSPPSTSGPPPTSLQESLRTPSLLGLSCERSPAAGLRGREHSRSPMLVILSWRNRTWSLHENTSSSNTGRTLATTTSRW